MEIGESVVRMVEKTGIALVDSPELSDKEEEHIHSKRDLDDRASDKEKSESQEKGKDPIRVYLVPIQKTVNSWK